MHLFKECMLVSWYIIMMWSMIFCVIDVGMFGLAALKNLLIFLWLETWNDCCREPFGQAACQRLTHYLFGSLAFAVYIHLMNLMGMNGCACLWYYNRMSNRNVMEDHLDVTTALEQAMPRLPGWMSSQALRRWHMDDVGKRPTGTPEW